MAGQIPFVDADPQQHPMEQFQRTFEIVAVFKEKVDQLWHLLNKCAQTEQKLRHKCHLLHTTFVKIILGND